MLHLEREHLPLEHGVRRPAPLHHQLPRAVPVELGDRPEQREEVVAVGGGELGHQARVDEDELGAEPLPVDLREGGLPAARVRAERPQPLQHLLRDVGGGGRVGRGGVPPEGQVEPRGLVEAHHDVAGVEVGVDEVVEEEHAEEGVEALVGEVVLEEAGAGGEEGRERDAVREFFDQDLAGCVFGVGVGEPGGGAVFEVFAEDGEVGGLDAQVELQPHHFAELGHFVGEGQPFDGGDGVEG